MSIYFLVHEATTYHQLVCPALAASWRQRRFAACQSLRAELLPMARAFAERFHIDLEESILFRLDRGLPFDRDIWRLLAGEVLLYSASEVPDIQTTPDTLCCLLAPDRYREGEVSRQSFAPIQQVYFGSRDVIFGSAYYRPDQAGLNEVDDVARLARYLSVIDPGQWTAADLASLREMSDEEERAEELEFAREWFPVLQALYQQAHERKQVIVCEIVQAPGQGIV